MSDFEVRPVRAEERFELAELIYLSLNHWHQTHGRSAIFTQGPRVTEAFWDTYQQVSPNCNFVALAPDTGRLMGSCFYHPRETHVSLGVMTVHPNYFGKGVGRALVQAIIDFTDENDYPALRLHSSAINLDSFSLYNRMGFVPYAAFQDMIVSIPEGGLPGEFAHSSDIRPATLDDVDAIAALEMDVSGIRRTIDYRLGIDNRDGWWSAFVLETRGSIDGFVMCSSHPAMGVIGPCVARGSSEALALIHHVLNLYPGGMPVVVVPMDQTEMVQQFYAWEARNIELHLCSVRGEFQPFKGVSLPTFLPETG